MLRIQQHLADCLRMLKDLIDSVRFAILLSLCCSQSWAQVAADFFDNKILQEIRLSLDSADWQKLHDNYRDKKTNYRADFSWRDIRITSVGVHTRGSGSLNRIKPGIGIEFAQFSPDQRFLGMRSLILRNFMFDPSTLHETLTMRVFERLGMPFQRTAHAKVFVNDVYAGLYELVEPIDSAFLATHFGEDSGYLYEAQGGQNFHFQYLGDWATPYVPTYFSPKSHTEAPQGEVVAAWVRAVNLSTDAEFVSSVGKYTDLGAFVGYAAVEVFMAEVDGMMSTSGMTNFYLYRRSSDDRFFVLPWDKEMTFGSPQWPILQALDDHVLLHRAMQIPELRKRYFDTMLQASEAIGGAGGWLEQEVNRQYELVREAVGQDPSRVCVVNDFPAVCPIQAFEDNVEYVRSFARERAAFVYSSLQSESWDYDSNGPQMHPGAIVNAASGTNVLAPGAMALLRVNRAGKAEERATSSPLPLELGGVAVRVGGLPSAIFIVSNDGIWIQVPSTLSSGPTDVVVEDDNGKSSTWPIELRSAAPGVFAITHSDGRLVTQAEFGHSEEVLVAWATGLGPAADEDAGGQIAPTGRLVPMKNLVTAMLGDQPLEVLWAGLAPGLTAVQQVQFRVPRDTPPNTYNFRIATAGEVSSNYVLPVQQ